MSENETATVTVESNISCEVETVLFTPSPDCPAEYKFVHVGHVCDVILLWDRSGGGGIWFQFPMYSIKEWTWDEWNSLVTEHHDLCPEHVAAIYLFLKRDRQGSLGRLKARRRHTGNPNGSMWGGSHELEELCASYFEMPEEKDLSNGAA